MAGAGIGRRLRRRPQMGFGFWGDATAERSCKTSEVWCLAGARRRKGREGAGLGIMEATTGAGKDKEQTRGWQALGRKAALRGAAF